MSNAKLIGIAPQLIVNNVVNTAEYYRDVLGFRIINFAGEPPVYAMVERDGFQIHFSGTAKTTITPNHRLKKDSVDFILWVPEIDSFYEEVKSRNAEIVQQIVKREYGSREFIISDSDGHTILVGD